ncbi:MAG: hypothetical protein PSX37_02950 [bacterium]|nr:hypothetical protein [bacterium]
MFASIVVTLLVVTALLCFLLNAAMTAAFSDKPPSGSNAMGLFVPVVLAIIGSVLFLLATWVCLARGGLDWLSPKPLTPTLIATAVTFGICLAAAGVLIAWMEKMGAWVPLGGFALGIFGPTLLALLILMSAWDAPAISKSSPFLTIANSIVVLISLSGFAIGAFGALKHFQHSLANNSRIAASQAAFETKWARIRARTPMEALREDYAEMSPETPLWVFIASLPERTEPDCRAFIIARALQVPNLSEDFIRTLAGDHPRYRHGCLDLLCFAPAKSLNKEWATPLLRAIDITSQQIQRKPDWLTPDSFSNPDPARHLESMASAVARIGETPQLTEALRHLKATILDGPESPDRTAALAALSEVADPEPAH